MKVDRVALLFSVLGMVIPAAIFMRICWIEKNTYNFWNGEGILSFAALAVFCSNGFRNAATDGFHLECRKSMGVK